VDIPRAVPSPFVRWSYFTTMKMMRYALQCVQAIFPRQRTRRNLFTGALVMSCTLSIIVMTSNDSRTDGGRARGQQLGSPQGLYVLPSLGGKRAKMKPRQRIPFRPAASLINPPLSLWRHIFGLILKRACPTSYAVYWFGIICAFYLTSRFILRLRVVLSADCHVDFWWKCSVHARTSVTPCFCVRRSLDGIF